MSVDVLLFWGRILFLVLLYLFLLWVVFSLSRDLRNRSASPEDAAPGELVIVEPAETGLRPDDAFPLMAETIPLVAPTTTPSLCPMPPSPLVTASSSTARKDGQCKI